jgi:hypothetical protein
VEWDEKEMIPRQACIEVFVAEGLIPFINTNGYRFKCNKLKLGAYVARSLYYSRIKHVPLNIDFYDEDYDYYYYHVNDDKWDLFWNEWALWNDVNGEHPHMREIVRYCVWTLLDIENSQSTDNVNNMFYESDDEDGFQERRREYSLDPYLVDAANGYF